MSGFFDLHVHSRYSSDADYLPRQLFEMACQSGLAGFAISDHDSLAAIEEGMQLAHEFSLEFIPNIEISTYHRSRQFHLLAPLVDSQSEELRTALQALSKARWSQAKERVAKLQGLGFDITLEEVLQKTCHQVPMGPAIAQVLLAKPESSQFPSLHAYINGEKAARGAIAFYLDFFAEGKPAFTRMEGLRTLDALQLIKQAGGVPVLAHPGAPGYETDEDIMDTFVAHGLEGLEVYSSYHTFQLVRRFSAWANRWGLVPTAGSDFHGKVKPPVSFGSIRARGREMIEELLERKA